MLVLAGCHSAPPHPASGGAAPATAATRVNDEIIIAGRRFHTGTSVVTWKDPGGYNAYVGREAKARARQGLTQPGLAGLQKGVDQFVLHYDGGGLSKICFNVLQQRKLSVHFLLDVDGTVYQTLDLQERALHATIANDRSIGIEIANVGAFPPGETAQLTEWYRREASGQTRLQVPVRISQPGILTPGFIARPARSAPVRGRLQGKDLIQYDFTPEQYGALIRLTAALCRIFPRLTCDYPHDHSGRLVTTTLPAIELANYRGVLGHFHIQANKVDPGPALDWRRLIEGAQARLK